MGNVKDALDAEQLMNAVADGAAKLVTTYGWDLDDVIERLRDDVGPERT